MRIICDNCQTEYDVTPEMLGKPSPGRRLKFRCSYCGHTFTPDFAERPRKGDDEGVIEGDEEEALAEEPEEEPPVAPFGMTAADHASLEAFRGLPPPVADAALPGTEPIPAMATGSLLLKQEGKIYHVRDIAALQRWIVERRVLAEDLVSREGVRWEPVGQQPDLMVFLKLVDQVETAEETPFSDEKTKPPTPPEDGWSTAEAPPWALAVPPDLEEAVEDEPTDKEREQAREVDEGRAMDIRIDIGPSGPYPRIDLGYRSAPAEAASAPTPVVAPLRPTPLPTPTWQAPLTDSPSVRVEQKPVISPRKPTSNAGIGMTAAVAGAIVAIALGGWYWLRQGSEPSTPQPVGEAVTVAAGTAPAPAVQSLVPPPQLPPANVDPRVASPAGVLPVTAPATPPPAGTVASAPAVVPPPAVEPPPTTSGSSNAAPKTAVSSSTGSATPTRKTPPTQPTRTSVTSSASTARGLVKKGWDAMAEKDYGRARQNFVDATALNPNDGWAQYGLAYAADKQGDLKVAKDAYCRAWTVGQGDLDLVREVEGRLRVLSVTCP